MQVVCTLATAAAVLSLSGAAVAGMVLALVRVATRDWSRQ